MTPARFFPRASLSTGTETSTSAAWSLGVIYKGTADNPTAMPFIAAGTNGLVSVLGLYADDPTNTLWVCSSDANNGALRGTAPVAIKAFNLTTGAATGELRLACADDDADPGRDGERFLQRPDRRRGRQRLRDRLLVPAHRASQEGRRRRSRPWVNDPVLGAGQWHMNGIDVDQSSGNVFVVDQGMSAQAGKLFRIPITATGAAGTITEITFAGPLKHPDGMKVIAPNLLAMGEAAGAVSMIKVTNNTRNG